MTDRTSADKAKNYTPKEEKDSYVEDTEDNTAVGSDLDEQSSHVDEENPGEASESTKKRKSLMEKFEDKERLKSKIRALFVAKNLPLLRARAEEQHKIERKYNVTTITRKKDFNKTD